MTSEPSSRSAHDVRLTQLAIAAGRGDQAALREFIALTQRDVWRMVAHLDSSSTADDLTQETFIRVIRSLPSFLGNSSARTWLMTIARRVVIDHIRSVTARPRLAAAVHQDDERRNGVVAGPAVGVELLAMLDALPAKRREAIVLTQIVGLSYAEVAEVAGCEVGTIRSRVFRAREALMAMMRDEGGTSAVN